MTEESDRGSAFSAFLVDTHVYPPAVVPFDHFPLPCVSMHTSNVVAIPNLSTES